MDDSELDPVTIAVCEAAADPMLIMESPEQRIVFANSALLRWTGLSSDRVVGRAAECLSDTPLPSAESRRWRIRTRDGRVQPVSLRIGSCEGSNLVAVTVRSGSSQELEERLALTYAAAHEGIWDWNPQSNELIWSDRFMEMVGIDGSSFEPKLDFFLDRLHPTDRARIEGALADHLAKGIPYDVTYRLRHEDGHYLTVHALGQALWDAKGEAKRMVGTVEDISEQVATREALNQTEARFRHLADNVPGAIFRYVMHADGSDEIEYMSPGCVDIWEIDAATIQGKPAALWEMILDEDLPTMQQSVLRSAETLKPWDNQWRVRTASGKLKWLHGRGMPVRLEDGGTMWNTLILDTTEQRATEAALQESRELFYRAQKMESLGQLTGGLAHDFNNLLAVILGNLELLADTADLGSRRKYVDDALTAAQRGRDLTHGLLAFARRASLEPESIDIESVITDLTRLLKRTLPESIRFETSIAPDLPQLVLDRAAFESALLNLVINARDAIDREGHITMSFRDSGRMPGSPADGAAGHYVEVEVRDTGAGMDAEMLRRVFEPFFTTKREGKGSGLGLSIVEGFVTQSGGSIRIDSQSGKGTTVHMRFPVGVTARSERPSSSPDRAAGDEDSFAGKTVLVAEDEEDVRRMLCNRLREEGFSVLDAANGARGIALFDAQRQNIDLVITDSVMPGLVQGANLARHVRAQSPQTPIVVVSGYLGDRHAETDGELAFAHARLDKPADKEQLLTTVRQVLRGPAR